jgi:hypothetical protein
MVAINEFRRILILEDALKKIAEMESISAIRKTIEFYLSDECDSKIN